MSRGLNVVVEPIAGLAVSTSILAALAQVCAAQCRALGILEGMQADRAQRNQGCGIEVARVAIWRYTSPSAGAYVTPVGRRKRQPESKQKRPTDSRNFPKGNRFRLPARPAYSRFSPIEQTFDS